RDGSGPEEQRVTRGSSDTLDIGRQNKQARAVPVILVVCALSVAAFLATGAAAGAATGKALANLKITADQVSIKRAGQSSFVAAKDGQALKQGDTLKTDATGRAEIDYTDGSLTRLAGSTVFTL